MQNQSRGRGSLLDLLLPGRGQQRRHWALRDVDFTVCEGESWGIIGHNGAGKSTLCLMLARILTPDEGSAIVRGEVTPLVTLGAAFNPALSGRDNLALYAAYLGISPEVMRERTPEIIAFAELAEFIDEPIRTYSTGMRARLGFAVATSLKPEILILDEVLSVGDRDFRAKSKAKIESLMADSKCILTVSHSVSFLRQICTHCLWLDHGRVKMAGPAREVLDAYEADGGAASRRK
ncbi:MAG: ABC transporter ATP-binding protein [Planctomycetota bacterium]